VLEKCASIDGSPRYLPRLVARLRSENADIEAAAIFLTELIQTTESEAAIATYQGALDEIDVEIKARYLERARASYRELFGRDIKAAGDLVAGDHPVLAQLPPPEPKDLPPAMRKGDYWFVDQKTGHITSTYYNRRYRVNSRAKDKEWKHKASSEQSTGVAS
jgi:hypothetical protein